MAIRETGNVFTHPMEARRALAAIDAHLSPETGLTLRRHPDGSEETVRRVTATYETGDVFASAHVFVEEDGRVVDVYGAGTGVMFSRNCVRVEAHDLPHRARKALRAGIAHLIDNLNT